MFDEQDRQYFYNEFKNNGYEVGSYDDFKKDLNNKEDRDWYYNEAKNMGYDVGTQADFDKMVLEPAPSTSGGAQQVAASTTPQSVGQNASTETKPQVAQPAAKPAAEKPKEDNRSWFTKWMTGSLPEEEKPETADKEPGLIAKALGMIPTGVQTSNGTYQPAPEIPQPVVKGEEMPVKDETSSSSSANAASPESKEAAPVTTPTGVVNNERLLDAKLANYLENWKQRPDKEGDYFENMVADLLADGTANSNEEAVSIVKSALGRYANRSAMDVTNQVVSSLPDDTVQDAEQSIEAQWYSHGVQDKLKQEADSMGISYDDYVALFLKPAMVQSLVNKYGPNYRNIAEGIATRLYAHDEHVQDRLMNQDINDALSSVISKYVNPSVVDEYNKAQKAGSKAFAEGMEGSQFIPANLRLGTALGAQYEANEAKDPAKVLSGLQKKFGRLYRNPEFLNDMSNAAFKVMQRYGLNGTQSSDPKQFKPMINSVLKNELDQLEIKGMMPKGSAEYIMKTGLGNTIVGKITRKAVQTDYQNWLEDIANQQYQPGFWENVASGALTFAGDAWSYWLPGAAGGKLTKSMLAKAEGRLAGDLMAKGMESRMATRAAKLLIGKSKTEALKSGAVHGAVTFGGQSAISKPIDEKYRTGQFDENGKIYNPSGWKIALDTLLEGGKQGALGVIMQGNTIANMIGKGRGLATNILADVGGKVADSGIMTGHQILERMAQDPNFKPTGKDAVETFLESGANLLSIGFPGFVGKYARFKDAREFNKKFDFTDQDIAELKRFGYDGLRDAFEKVGIGEYSVVGENAQRLDGQLTQKYMNLMNDKSVPEVLKAKMMAVVEGKRPSSFSPVVDSVIVQPMDNGGKAYLETLNKDGGIIERKEYSSLDEAQKADKKLEYEKTLGLASVLEGEFHNEFTQEHLDGLYNQAAQKYNMGEKLTDEDKAAVYLHQNAGAIKDIMDKQQKGIILTEEEQKQVDTYRHFYNSALENSSVMREFVNTFEDSHGVARGTLRKALESKDKKYASLVESYLKELYNSIELKREMKQTMDDLYNTAHGNEQKRIEQSGIEGEKPAAPVEGAASVEGAAPVEGTSSVEGAAGGQEPPVSEGPAPYQDRTNSVPSPSDANSAAFVMGQEAYKNGDSGALKAIDYNSDLATGRLKRAFADSDTMFDLVTKAYNEGRDMEQFVAQRSGNLTPAQKEAISKYVEAMDAKKGAIDALQHVDDGYGDALKEQLWPYQTEDGNIVPATLTSGKQVFLKKANEYGGGFVVVPDEQGQPTIKQVSNAEIKEVGTPVSLDEYIESSLAQQKEARNKQFISQFDGSGLKPNDRVVVAMEEGDANIVMVFAGYSEDGKIVLTDGKDNIALTREEFDTWRTNALNNTINERLDREDGEREMAEMKQAEADKQERYKKGIFGYAAGQPDYSDTQTDPKVAAEYLQETAGEDRKALFANIVAEKQALQKRINQLRDHIASNEEWLSINADLDQKNAETRTLANKQMEGQIADLQARFDNWNKIRSAVMTLEEAQAIKAERTQKIADTGVNEGDVAPIEGREIAVLSDEELKKQYPTMDEASDFIASERKRIYRIQSDEVQREIDGVDGVLDRFVNGEIDLEPEQIKELNTTKAQLEARQANLTESAKDLKAQADKLKTLYRKENMEARAKAVEDMTPAEQRAIKVENAIKNGNMNQLNSIYEDVRGATDFNDTEPNTLEEYVANNIGRFTLNYEGKEKGGAFSNGIQQETGLGRKDFEKLQILAKEGEGKTVPEFVHSLYDDMPMNLKQMGYTDHDIRSAFLDLIGSAQSYSDIKNYTLNNKVANVEQLMRDVERQEEEMKENSAHSEAFDKIVELAKEQKEYWDLMEQGEVDPDDVPEVDVAHDMDELLKTLSDEEFKEVNDVLMGIDEEFEYFIADEYERREGTNERKKKAENTNTYDESIKQALKPVTPFATALKSAVESGDKKAIKKAQKELTDALIASDLGHDYLSGQLAQAKLAKKKDELYKVKRATIKPLTDAIRAIESAYNPYLHTSRTPLNDQFSEAQNRPNIVTVEVEVPKSELTSGYKADKAKDAVGEVEWKAGIIQGQLTGKRKVVLSRWDKPVRIVPDSEVADVIVNDMFKGKNITMPSNVVTPSLRKELEKRGVPFVETDNRGRIVGGENDGVHYSKVYGKKANVKYRFGDSYDYEKYPLGRVEPNLANKDVKIVHADANHGFKNFKEARNWAKKNIVKIYTEEETGGKRLVRISNTALDKYLSQKAVDKSDSQDVHLAVLKVLPSVLKESIDAETHPDFIKGADGERRTDNGINKDLLVHRCYGAVNIDGKIYRVKITLKEEARNKDLPHKAYSYEATKIELLAGTLVKPEGDNPNTNSSQMEPLEAIDAQAQGHGSHSNNSISVANLLKNVEMSYDKGKKLLDESEKMGILSENERKIADSVVNTANKLGGAEATVYSSLDDVPEEYRSEVEQGAKGWYDPETHSVHVYLPNCADANEAERTVLHEKIGHEGMEVLLGGEDEVRKFANFVYNSVAASTRGKILEIANEYDPDWKKHDRMNVGTQEYIARLAEEGPKTAEDFSLWTKIKHYLIKVLKKLGIRVPGLLNDKDLRYYLMKAGKALHVWDEMPPEKQEAMMKQASNAEIKDALSDGAGKGKPRQKKGESMIQYMKRVQEWRKWKNAREDENDPEPPMFYDIDKDEAGKKEWAQLNKDWRERHHLAGEEPTGLPIRMEGEEDGAYMTRIHEYEKWKDAMKDQEDPMPDMFAYEKKKQEEVKRKYEDWLARHELLEQQQADLDLYEGKIYPAETNPKADDLEQQVMQDLAEVTSTDVSKEGAAKTVKHAVIHRRKNMEEASADDAIYINDVKNRIEKMADSGAFDKLLSDYQGKPNRAEKLAEAIPYIIEAPRRLRDLAHDLNATGAFDKGHIHIQPADVEAIQPYVADLIAETGKKHTELRDDKEVEVYDDPQAVSEVASKMAQVINDNHQGEEGFVPIDGTDILSEHVLPLVKQQIVPEGIDYKNLSPEMKAAIDSIRDWYNYTYDWLKDNRTLKEDTGYNVDYVNHIWDKEKSDKQAYALYVENRQRTKSPNEKKRTISTLMEGISVGLVPKTTDITKMMAYYSRSNIEAWVNKTMLQELSGLNVIERNEDGEVVSTDPLLSSSAPFNLEQYKYFEIPGVGPVWVYNVSPKQVKVKNPITGKEKVLYSEASAGDRFGVVFETYQSSPFWKAFDTLASSAKKLELGFSGFHAGALTEVYMVQNMVEFGPKKAMANFMKYIFVDSAKNHEQPCFANPQDFQEAASHLVKFGATNDYAAADVQNMFDNMRDAMMKVQEKLRDGNGISGTVAVATMPLKVVTQMLSLINKGMDRALWDFLHDGLKLATYRMRADKTKERAKKGWTEEELNRALDEDGQFVNDMFGGQHWDVLGASHRTLRYAGRVLLSPDWNASTTRHFLALTGFGSIWNEATFENFKQYYQRLWHKELMPEDEGRRSRQISSLLCYGIGFMVFYETFANGINAAFRALDEEKEHKKAEEIRKTNPSYKSMYELAYGDEGMKWYDYLMRGNSLGQQSKIFMGRYEDGTEMYIRHGKQFREVPEYLFNHKGELEFPGPMVQRMIGKANPMVRMTLDDINYLSDFQASHADQEIQRKYGKTIGLLYKDALYWAPFLIPSQENKEFKAVDFFFPSSKGFSPWKAQSYFKDFILSGDMEGVVMTYQSCQRNGIDAEAQIKAAIGSVKALESAEMNDGVTSLQEASQRFDAAKSITEKKKMRQKMKKFLSQSDYKAFTQKEALDMVQGYLNGDEDLKEMEKAESKYLMAAKAEDVTEDWRIQNVWNGTMEAYQEYQRLKDIDKAKANAFKNSKTNKRLFAARKAISAAKRKMNKAKKQMDGTNGAAKMAEIRKTRKELLNTLNGME